MPAYDIQITDEAERDLAYYRAYERKLIIEGIFANPSFEPTTPTANQKPLRANSLAT
jgi:hypothetical protein